MDAIPSQDTRSVSSIDFPVTRWSLIARLPGQPQQVAALIGLYADAIGAYLAVKLTGERRERIDDIIQEVLLDLLGRPELLSQAEPGSGSRFRYYVMNLAWLAARNHLRHARRRDHAQLDEVAEDPASTARSADQHHSAMDRAWAMSVVQGALDDVQRWTTDGQLEPEALAVLQANLIEGQGLREVAQATGMSLATCSRRLARARMLLQQSIADRLRLAGDLAAGDDPTQACTVLLEALRQSG